MSLMRGISEVPFEDLTARQQTRARQLYRDPAFAEDWQTDEIAITRCRFYVENGTGEVLPMAPAVD